MSQEGMFAAIEKVMAERTSRSGKYTVGEKIIDVLSASPEPMSTREVKLVLAKLGQGHSHTTITTCMGEMIDLGRAEFVGKAMRQVRHSKHSVPLYTAVKDEA